MARKKRAWGPSNPLWRYLHRKTSTHGRKRGKTSKRRGGTMARRKSSRRSSGGGMGGMGRGLFPVGGVLGAAMIGIGAAAVAKRFIGAPLGGLTGAAAGFVVGGPAGAAGGYVHDNIGNVMPGQSSGTTGGTW